MKIKRVLLLCFLTIVFLGFGAIFARNLFKSNSLINLSELPEDFIEEYLATYSSTMAKSDKDNILIVTSMRPLNDTFGAISVVNAPNHQYFLQYASEAEKTRALSEFSHDEEIKVSENHVYEFTDDDINELEHIYNSWGIEAMGLDHTAELIDQTDVPEITVAIIDTGLDMELFNASYAGKVVETYNVVDPDAEMTDTFGHGTHVAGTIAEGTPSNVKILPVKVSDDGRLYTTDIVTAVNYITYYEKASVINMSFGGYASDDAEYQVIEAANAKNIISVAAAGNESTNQLHYPSSFDNTLSISAVDSEFMLADFSNYGEATSFAAPGVDILSLNGVNSGTSMAAPHAASAVAVLKSLNSNLSLEEVTEILKEYSVDLGAKGWDQRYGYGFIDFSGVEICPDGENFDCDEYGIFETDIPNQIEIVSAILTPYNYGSLTNILASTLKISTTNGRDIIKPLGDFEEINITGYDPYAVGEQIVSVEYAGLETSFTITNPANFESGWGYSNTGGGSAILNEYKDHGLDIKTLYFPSELNGLPVISAYTCTFKIGCNHPKSNDALNYTTVVLPETLTNAGTNVFGYEPSNTDNGSGFKKLQHVISLADELTVGGSTFNGLVNLHTIDATIMIAADEYYDFNTGETNYSATNVFTNDKSLREVHLSENNTVIPDVTFEDCGSLEYIDIPESVTVIGTQAFAYSGLKQISGGEGLVKIGDWAFRSTFIEEFYVPKTVTHIGHAAFCGARKLESLVVDPENPIFDSRDDSNAIIETATNKLIVGIITTTIPETVDTIASGAFAEVYALSEIEIPEGVTTIENQAFAGSYVYKAQLPNSLESMDPEAFDVTMVRSEGALWVYRDSYAHEAAVEYDFPYVIIGEADPAPIYDISIWFPRNAEEDRNTFRAFQTVNSENLEIYVYYIEGDELLEELVENYTVEYQDDLDSLRATQDGELFMIGLTFDTATGYHNRHITEYIEVNKAYPDFEVPTGLTADPEQTLSEITLPDGFSWMDEDVIITGAGDMTYYAKFTPEDTDNYEIVEDIPIIIYVNTDKTQLTPEFSVSTTIIRDDTTPLSPSIITVTNMEPQEYEVSNLSSVSMGPTTVEITFTLRMSDEKFESYYFEGGVQEKEFTTHVNAVYSSNNYEAMYDGEYHSITFNLDISTCTVSYSEDEGVSYGLTELPTYMDVGMYIVYYKISCDGHNDIVGSNMVLIKGITVDPSVLRGGNIRITNNSISDLLGKINVVAAFGVVPNIFGPDGEQINYLDDEGATVTTDSSLEVWLEETPYTYGIAVVGDVTGDGLVAPDDLSLLRQHLIGSHTLNGLYFLAGDIVENEVINSGDLLKLKRHLLGLELIGEE